MRTALVAWALARQSGRKFYLRIDDIDPGRNVGADSQIRDLAALGIDWDGPVRYQSKRRDRYEEALGALRENGHIFECHCSRKDIREAVRAPHVPPTHYPGTCLHSPRPRTDRAPALRLWPSTEEVAVNDLLSGTYAAPIDAFVVRRGDGLPAYNLASVVDDMDWNVDQVVRGEDLLVVAPSQKHLGDLLGGWNPLFVHVPLVLGPDGKRLAKRDHLATLEQIDAGAGAVLRFLADSVGVAECSGPDDFLTRFSLDELPREPVRGVETVARFLAARD